MDWTIREAEAGDYDRLALVGAATFLDTFAGILDGESILLHCAREHSAAAYAKYLAYPPARGWLAEAGRGSAPVGYAIVTVPDLPGAGEGDLEVKRIYLLSRFHRAGIGRALMESAAEHARRCGAERLVLGVYGRNERAILFYEAVGFVRTGTRRFTVGNRTHDDVVLALRL